MNRRSFLISLTTLIASPAIVRASSLMSVVPLPKPIPMYSWGAVGRMIVHVDKKPDGTLDITMGEIDWGPETLGPQWQPLGGTSEARSRLKGLLRSGYKVSAISPTLLPEPGAPSRQTMTLDVRSVVDQPLIENRVVVARNGVEPILTDLKGRGPAN